MALGEHIDGWMDPISLEWLYETAKTMEHVVEVGSYRGRSTFALLSGCKGLVYAVDPLIWSYQDNVTKVVDSTRTRANLELVKNVGMFSNFRQVRLPSKAASRAFDDKSIDMVFIDGLHSYDAVKEDIECWLPKTKKIICGHDYMNSGYPGVKKSS